MYLKHICTILHFIHLYRIEYPLIILGWIMSSYSLGVMGVIIFLFRKTITLDHFDSAVHHSFIEGRSIEHSLEYYGHIPVFTIFSASPYTRGFTHGKFLFSYIRSLHYRVLFLSMFKTFPAQRYLSVPDDIVVEITGLVDGYNSHSPWIKLTYGIVLNWHMLPMACTTSICKDPETPVFVRNMDWVPYGNIAAYTLIIKYKYLNISALSIPGMVGVITGWNTEGMILAMNVCANETYGGVPAVFNNRLILEVYDDTKTVCKNLNDINPSPYGAYHLTILDKCGIGTVISYYQSSTVVDGAPLHTYTPCRNFNYNSDELITFNHTYSDHSINDNGRFFSDARSAIKKEHNNLPMSEIIKLPLINNWITCHTLILDVYTGIALIGFDNGFSATSKLHSYPLGIKRELRLY